MLTKLKFTQDHLQVPDPKASIWDQFYWPTLVMLSSQFNDNIEDKLRVLIDDKIEPYIDDFLLAKIEASIIEGRNAD